MNYRLPSSARLQKATQHASLMLKIQTQPPKPHTTCHIKPIKFKQYVNPFQLLKDTLLEHLPTV